MAGGDIRIFPEDRTSSLENTSSQFLSTAVFGMDVPDVTVSPRTTGDIGKIKSFQIGGATSFGHDNYAPRVGACSGYGSTA
jgi:hypothetical protein